MVLLVLWLWTGFSHGKPQPKMNGKKERAAEVFIVLDTSQIDQKRLEMFSRDIGSLSQLRWLLFRWVTPLFHIVVTTVPFHYLGSRVRTAFSWSTEVALVFSLHLDITGQSVPLTDLHKLPSYQWATDSPADWLVSHLSARLLLIPCLIQKQYLTHLLVQIH